MRRPSPTMKYIRHDSPSSEATAQRSKCPLEFGSTQEDTARLGHWCLQIPDRQVDACFLNANWGLGQCIGPLNLQAAGNHESRPRRSSQSNH
jgi:hypothetical protein